jgi:RNA polymerase sigma factor (sigma-70 family)
MRSDEELMAAYVKGDQEAFRELFRRYAPVVLGIARRGAGSRDEAEDLVQQTFLQVHRGRLDFRPDARLRPWLLTIALNVKREFLRRQVRNPVRTVDAEMLDGWASEQGDPERAVGDARVRLAVERLPGPQREVVELHWFAGLSFGEIAQALGATESAVKLRAFRAYRVLRDHFEAIANGRNAQGTADRNPTDGLQ